jgi:hypothetical protein
MDKRLAAGLVLVMMLTSMIGCTSITITTAEKATLPALTNTQTVTTTSNSSTTSRNVLSTTTINTVTITSTVNTTTIAVTSVKITSTLTITNTITNVITTTVMSGQGTTTSHERVAVPIGVTITAPILLVDPRLEHGGPLDGISTRIHIINITVLEVVRGDKAWEMVKATNVSNKAADTGFEYLIARVKLDHVSGDTLPYTLNREIFVAYSSENKTYTAPSIVEPQPAFIGALLYVGQTANGWITYLVSQKDNKPAMFYSGSSTWFQLY